MKRDMDLVRDILCELGDSDRPLNASVFTSDVHGPSEVVYHFEIMDEAGLIKTDIERAAGGDIINARAISLTWAGNEFLASIADDDVWKNVKKTVAKKLIDAPIEVFSRLATAACMSAFGV